MPRPDLAAVSVFVPGYQGGVASVANTVFGHGFTPKGRNATVISTKSGRGRWEAIDFGLLAMTCLVASRRGQLELAHLNVSVRGSTARKMLLSALVRLGGGHVVLQLHSGNYPDFFQSLPKPIRALVRRFFRNADHVLVLGESFRGFAIEELGVAPDQVSVVGNAVVEIGAPSTEVAAETPQLVFLGRFHAAKGVYDLLEALGTPELQAQEWSAVFAGNDEVQGVADAAARFSLADRVEIREWLSPAQVQELLGRSAIFVLPSYHEGMSVALLEAMANGLACACSPVGAHGDLVVDGVNGKVVEAGDTAGLANALSELIGSPELRTRLGQAARADYLAAHNAEAVQAAVNEIYGRVLDDSSRASL